VSSTLNMAYVTCTGVICLYLSFGRVKQNWVDENRKAKWKWVKNKVKNKRQGFGLKRNKNNEENI